MVMGHIGFGKLFDHYIHAFHMPMFFFVSGYFFNKKKPFLLFIYSKVKALILPYLLYTFIIYFLWKSFYNSPEESLPYILVYMNTSGFIASGLWFLTALFLANCVYWILNKITYNKLILNIMVGLVSICGNLIHMYYGKPCVFAFDAAMVGVGMLHVGFLFKNKSTIINKLEKMSWYMIITGLVLNVVLIFINSKVNMREGNYGIVPLFWVNAIGSSILLWALSFELEKHKNDYKVISGALSLLHNIGKRSLTFLSLNQVIIHFVLKINPYENLGGFGKLLHNMVGLIIVLCIIYMIAYIVEMVNSTILKELQC